MRKPNGAQASEWQAPQEMRRIAAERTTDIVGAWALSFRWGKSTVQILAESCYMQAINDMIDAMNDRNLLSFPTPKPRIEKEGAD